MWLIQINAIRHQRGAAQQHRRDRQRRRRHVGVDRVVNARAPSRPSQIAQHAQVGHKPQRRKQPPARARPCIEHSGRAPQPPALQGAERRERTSRPRAQPRMKWIRVELFVAIHDRMKRCTLRMDEFCLRPIITNGRKSPAKKTKGKSIALLPRLSAVREKVTSWAGRSRPWRPWPRGT